MNKRIFMALIGSVLIIGLVLAGCSGEGLFTTPSAVVKKAYTAADKGDTKALFALMSPEVAEIATPYAAIVMQALAAQIGSKGPIVKTEEQINGNTARVTITLKNGDAAIVSLMKTDGKWKISDFNEHQSYNGLEGFHEVEFGEFQF
jgi:PBP1b-binding outer membrane lipoprotein LpoB